jgi:hypothetical protein
MSYRSSQRRGASSLEAIVGFTLLSAALTLATQLVVQHSRLLRTQRDYRLALDEVSNQFERLSFLPARQLSGALSDLKPSELIAHKLPGAELQGELHATDIGQNLTLRISWPGPYGTPMTVSLATWLPPSSSPRAQP